MRERKSSSSAAWRGASCAAPAQARRKCRNPHGRTRPVWRVRIDVRTNCEAVRILPNTKTIELRDVLTDEVTSESYDKLVLSPGALSVRPPLPGIDLPGIFQVRTVPDARAIRDGSSAVRCS
ncbi:MAG: FAD-dependent oxidoreductase [Dechloromonas sp.]|uniref:FAD-dependent oxidoreductase n=1 Tax=Candidatus Dechloromonas phosphorivorans TaxID=2899244 RepID=A0A9D7LLB5_9RHOO|nr:FAD-dependent oxidoreductase [Candidatus Dechloromonas phosphorivorans]